MMSNSNSFPFEKLRGRENFDVWKRHAQSYLVIKDCWSAVKDGVTSSSTEKEISKDERALAEITLMLDPSTFAHIAKAKTSKEAWDALQKSFTDTGLTRKVELLKQLVQLNLSDCESMQDYVNTMVMTSLKVTNAGLKIDDELTASLMLAGLPDDFRALVLAVENSKTALTVDTVKDLLLQDAKFDNKNADSALYSKNRSKTNKFRCHSCNQIGHFSRSCPSRSKNNSKELDKKHDAKGKKGAFEKLMFASLLVNDNNSSDWIVDSGATAHMTNDNELLFNKHKITNKEVIVANKTKIPVKCAGDVKLSCNAGNRQINAVVKNVEHVPDLCANLLSVRQMTKIGNKVVFENDDCKIFDNERQLIATATAINDLYRLNFDSINIPNESDSAMAVVSNFSLWHRRMGHMCDENLNKVKNASVGIDFVSVKHDKCVTCIKGKHSRESFNTEGKRASNFLDLVHSDVCGPFQKKSFSGARYLLTFIDDCSRKVFGFAIKNKSDVFNEFINFKNLVENQCSKKIKILRTDGGTEYNSNIFKQFYSKHGILHQTTAPYTPQQNGVAERMNRTITDRICCMLLDSGLGQEFWAEAANTAIYLINRMPCRDKIESPEGIWSNEKPSLKHLRVFGCRAFAHIPKQKRTKLDAKSIECIFIGYSNESKAYRLFNPINKKIVISRDVVFIETETEVIENKSINTNSSLSPSVELFESISSDVDNSEEEAEIELPTQEDAPFEEADTDQTVIGNENAAEDSTFLDLGEANRSTDYESAADSTFTPDENISIIESDEVRRSERIGRLPQPNYTHCVMSDTMTDPMTVEEAMSRSDAHLWKAAMQEEFESLMTNKTWFLTDLPNDKKVIKSKWVFKVKRNTEGEVVRHKARLVVKGYSQKKGIDYEETFAPVVRYTSIRLLLAIAVKFDLTVYQMDAVTAFLNGDLKEDIYITQPSGYDDKSGQVCKLQKSLYGLKQSSRAWNDKLNHVLINIGLKRSTGDQCIYYRVSEAKMIFVAIYVDDVLIFTNDVSLLNHLKSELSKNFRMKDMGIATSILGIRITRNEKEKTITIDQSQYIADILRRFAMDDCNPISTPIDVNQKLSSQMCPTNACEVQEMSNVPYMQAIGSLLFAAQITRPDICFAVNLLSRFGANPGKAHWSAVKRVLRYLKGTINMSLTYKKDDSEITGYCDADWASDLDERRSTTGYVFMFQGGAISWSAKRQQTIALSTAESELMSMVAAIQELIWLKRIEKQLIPFVTNSMLLNCDNKSAIDFANNNSYSQRTKHIDIKDKFVRQKLKQGLIKLRYIPTDSMLADVLTKGLNANKHNHLTSEFGLGQIK